jgi:glycerophosphoryl diester phosphodiesterase
MRPRLRFDRQITQIGQRRAKRAKVTRDRETVYSVQCRSRRARISLVRRSPLATSLVAAKPPWIICASVDCLFEGLRVESRAWRPLIIGHRGASGEAPENTLASFHLAMQQKADGIEFDVHLSRDGVPVVIHDSRLERTTSGHGRVRDHTAAELKRLDAASWFNRCFPSRKRAEYAGEKIPTLSETLAWVRANYCLAYLEIKRGRVPYPGIEERVLVEVRSAGVLPQVTVISFHVPTLRRLRWLDPHIGLGIDFTQPLAALQRAKSLGAGIMLPHWKFASPRFIARAHQAGRRVIVWGLDQPDAMRRKIDEGVDGIITSYPGKLIATWADME